MTNTIDEKALDKAFDAYEKSGAMGCKIGIIMAIQAYEATKQQNAAEAASGDASTRKDEENCSSSSATSPVTHAAGEGDWPEDFSQENGNYMCHCFTCKKTFMGYKRRLECKLCHNLRTAKPVASCETMDTKTAEQLSEIERVAMAIIRADEENGYDYTILQHNPDISDWSIHLAKAAISATKREVSNVKRTKG